MINDEEVEKAASWIRDNADKIAKARSEANYLSEYRKSKKAALVLTQTGTIQERESYAYNHPEYLEVLDGLREAEEEYERLRWLMVAAREKIEIFRTQSANNRIIDNSHR